MYSSGNNRRSLRRVLLALLVGASLAGIFLGVALYSNGVSPQPHYYGWWFGGPVGWLFFLPLVFLIFLALRFSFWRGPWGWGRRGWYFDHDDPAVETLKQRFAHGEITKEQFEQMKNDLEQG